MERGEVVSYEDVLIRESVGDGTIDPDDVCPCCEKRDCVCPSDTDKTLGLQEPVVPNESTETGRDVGDSVYVLGAGMHGKLTRITKNGIGWVKIKSRWGNHHHPITAKTFRYPMDRIVPEKSAP
jgi:hypothetical protein